MRMVLVQRYHRLRYVELARVIALNGAALFSGGEVMGDIIRQDFEGRFKPSRVLQRAVVDVFHRPSVAPWGQHRQGPGQGQGHQQRVQPALRLVTKALPNLSGPELLFTATAAAVAAFLTQAPHSSGPLSPQSWCATVLV